MAEEKKRQRRFDRIMLSPRQLRFIAERTGVLSIFFGASVFG